MALSEPVSQVGYKGVNGVTDLQGPSGRRLIRGGHIWAEGCRVFVKKGHVNNKNKTATSTTACLVIVRYRSSTRSHILPYLSLRIKTERYSASHDRNSVG